MHFSNDEFDFSELQQEAQHRWLKPAEVLFILQNHEKFKITAESPTKPPSGSLFLFNRRILRFFRKDGYNWRKKRDGRTVGEAHERLKVGNVDALNCYYAHGEDNPNFQRRSYWMLDGAYEHIVLVHYREVSEVRTSSGSISSMVSEVSSTFNSHNTSFSSPQSLGQVHSLNQVYNQPWNSVSPGSLEEVSSGVMSVDDYGDNLNVMDRAVEFGTQSKPEVSQTLRRLAEQLSLDDDDGHISMYYPENVPSDHGTEKVSQFSDVSANNVASFEQDLLTNLLSDKKQGQFAGKEKVVDESYINSLLPNPGIQGKQHGQTWSDPIERRGSPSWKEMLELSSSSAAPEETNLNKASLHCVPRTSANGTTELGGHSKSEHSTALHERGWSQFSSEEKGISLNPDEETTCLAWGWKVVKGNRGENGSGQPSADNVCQQLSAARQFLLGTDNLELPTLSSLPQHDEKPSASQSLLRSDIHVGDHHDGILRRESSLEWTETKGMSISCSKYSPEYYGTLFDQENHLGQPPEADSGLTVSQVQRFTIREISPDWAYSTEGSKVIIIGDFLCDPSEYRWCCMFGDIEIPVELVQKGVLRCQAPPHVTGKVPFCITSGNRESCSEIREFEYRFKPHAYPAVYYGSPEHETLSSRDELLLLVKFTQMVLHGNAYASTDGVESKGTSSDNFKVGDNQWERIIDSILDGSENSSDIKDWLLQELLKVRLEQWLLEKCQHDGTTDCSLTKHEQGVVHMIAALGYEWALNKVLRCGVVINFRDHNGWTALHWAAKFGREKMVAALLAAGAFAGAVTDPTSQEPSGRTAAAIAAANGHKGLAAYLSEVALTSHLSSLTLGETEISKGSAAVEAEKTVESISERSSVQLQLGVTEDQLSLKDSLAAVRNAAQAAARIQSAFRAHSFRKRQQKGANQCDECGMTQDDIRGLVAASKLHKTFRSLHDHRLDIAATRIQRKYLSWKGRKDFLTLRRNVVKIQAHVRGHQVRKKYKEFVWTVGVLEKVILRWRRKGAGLRGFKAEQDSTVNLDEDDDILKVFRKQKVDLALDEALSRVLSLVDSPDARHQYRRMLESYKQAKAERQIKDTHCHDDSMEADDMNQFRYQ
ncbi:Calmodulin-binding transcription activator 4 [Nymphaea thermarum]|nr:Calmodulin-binding transcription activator 4 [Nymphaea thermarum]